VRTAHTLHVGFEVSCNSQVGCVAQPRTLLGGYAGYGLLHVGFEVPRNSQIEYVAQPRMRLLEYAGYGLL
jgi:hypothetical protein